MDLKRGIIKKMMSPVLFDRLKELAANDHDPRFHHLFLDKWGVGVSVSDAGFGGVGSFYATGNKMNGKKRAEVYEIISLIPDGTVITGIGYYEGMFSFIKYRFQATPDNEKKLLDILPKGRYVTQEQVEEKISEVGESFREQITNWGDAFNLAERRLVESVQLNGEEVTFAPNNFSHYCNCTLEFSRELWNLIMSAPAGRQY